MWCYQKPGFEALLLAELQKQQQSSQFCDTLLKADGVSVPVHSCILSAISPHFSSSLSSSPAVATGQARLLEFRTLGACTLLHLVRLLYSGKMIGDSEKEKQEAISAAATLGIHGLVEVLNSDSQQREPQNECLYIEVGVQTESQVVEEHQIRLGSWRREVQDGATLLWRERLSTHSTEMWTQTEDLQMCSASSSQLPVSYKTIDMNALQTLGHSDPLQIPYVPMAVVYTNEDNHSSGQSSISAATPLPVMQYPSVETKVFPIPSQPTHYVLETSKCGPEANRGAVMEEWPEAELEKFEGNITGFINHFLNHEKEECSNKRRGRRRQGAGVGGLRQAGTRTRGRPQRRRGRLMQTVDVQDVGVSKLSKMYLQRCSMYVNRTGQGGGAVGRQLYMKTRAFVRSGRCTQKRKAHGIEWNIDQCANILLKSEAGTSGHRSRLRRGANTQQHKPSPVQCSQIGEVPQARGLEEQPEQIDSLLEEVMMGLDILPKNKNKSQVLSSPSHETASFTAVPVQNQRGHTSVMTMASRDRDLFTSEVSVLQQQQEGELTDILDQFLQSFERLESVAAQGCTESVQPRTNVTEYSNNNMRLPVHKPPSACPTGTPAHPGTSTQSATSGTDRPMTSVHSQQSQSRSEKPSSAVKGALKKPGTKSKKNILRKAVKKERVKQHTSTQLQQTPVVKLEWIGTLPENIKLKDLTQSAFPRAKGSSSNSLLWCTKNYPIRSRFREAQIMDSSFFLEQPLSDRRGKLPKTERRVSSQTIVEERIENNADRAGPDSTTRGRKRRWDSDLRTSEVEVKRICLDPPESISQNTSAEEAIDVETVSLISTSNTVLTANSETIHGEADVTEECTSDIDSQSNDIINVDSYFGEGTKEDMVQEEVICSFRANIVTKTNETEDLDDEVDVTEDSSPAPAPVHISWTDSSESDNDSEMSSPEEQTVILSKGHLVRC